MLARRAAGLSGSAICLRCQLRLLQSTNPRRSAIRLFASESEKAGEKKDENIWSGFLTDIRKSKDEAEAETTRTAGTDAYPSPDPDFELEPGRDERPERPRRSRPARQKRQERPMHESKSDFRRLNLRKRHMSGRRILDEAVASLGTDMLGKPASAIIMKDRGLVEKRDRPSDPDVPELVSEHDYSDIEALLDSERQPATLEESRANIHELKPDGESILSERDFRKLQATLVDSFLSPQLQNYLDCSLREQRKREQEKEAADEEGEEAGEAEEEEIEEGEGELEGEEGRSLRESQEADNANPASTAVASPEPEFSWISSMSPWVPMGYDDATAVTAPSDAHISLQGYIDDLAASKEKLAVRILRECWGLSITELSSGLGETRIKLTKSAFALLMMRGTQRFVNMTVKKRLDPGEKIESFPDQNALRLVTKKHKVELLIRDFDTTLSKVATKTVPLGFISDGPIDDAALEEASRITNTYLEKSTNQKRLHVKWIEVRQPGHQVGLEDLRHVVFRLLRTAFGSQRATTSLATNHADRQLLGRLVPNVSNQEALSWRDKLIQWGRFVLPLPAEEESSPATSAPLPQLPLPYEPDTSAVPHAFARIDAEAEPAEASPFPNSEVRWSNKQQTSTTAHFGHLLHPRESLYSALSIDDVVNRDSRRVLSPITPHPLQLTRLDTTIIDGTNHYPLHARSTILLRFWPAPYLKKQHAENEPAPEPEHDHAPVLELQLATFGDHVEGVESLRAISRTHHADVLLPGAPVDLRFTQAHHEVLAGPSKRALGSWQPLRDFLSAARLDLGAGKLDVPPRQRFPIPRRLFQSTNPHPQQQHQQQDSAEQLVSTVYQFVGLELRRTVAVPHRGHRLLYTAVEAGQGGGRRAEIALEPVAAAAATNHANPDHQQHQQQPQQRGEEDFLACCLDLARDNYLWSGAGFASTSSSTTSSSSSRPAPV
ncbi:mitochondrial inner-membrane-bound regulator-domain-containing protein [Xylariomycetidae sp. FL0641]|nr:mitochondrial inner-membrane-bound regulator-domain-containing protein [Xylariomycetidae sp. FL0641]